MFLLEWCCTFDIGPFFQSVMIELKEKAKEHVFEQLCWSLLRPKGVHHPQKDLCSIDSTCHEDLSSILQSGPHPETTIETSVTTANKECAAQSSAPVFIW